MQFSNQINEGVEAGMLDLMANNSIFPCKVSPFVTEPLKAGMAVTFIGDSQKGPPAVEEVSVTNPYPFGVVVYNPKKLEFNAEDSLEVAAFNSVIYVEAESAMPRGFQIGYNPATGKYRLLSPGDPVAGITLDSAHSEGHLIRMAVVDVTNKTVAI